VEASGEPLAHRHRVGRDVPARFRQTFAGVAVGTSPRRGPPGPIRGCSTGRRGVSFRSAEVLAGRAETSGGRTAALWNRRAVSWRRRPPRFGDVPPSWACGRCRGRAGNVSTRLRAASRSPVYIDSRPGYMDWRLGLAPGRHSYMKNAWSYMERRLLGPPTPTLPSGEPPPDSGGR
jgi:hypothetical protein